MSFASLLLAPSPISLPSHSSCAQTLWFPTIEFRFKRFYFPFKIKRTWPPCCLYCLSVHWISLPCLFDILEIGMGPAVLSFFGSVTSPFSTAHQCWNPFSPSLPLDGWRLLEEMAHQHMMSVPGQSHPAVSHLLLDRLSGSQSQAQILTRFLWSPLSVPNLLSPNSLVSCFTPMTEVIRADSCQLPVSL